MTAAGGDEGYQLRSIGPIGDEEDDMTIDEDSRPLLESTGPDNEIFERQPKARNAYSPLSRLTSKPWYLGVFAILGIVIGTAFAILWVRANSGADIRDLRRRQLSQLTLLKTNTEALEGPGRKHNEEMLNRLEQCLTGDKPCPPRPVILSSYLYIGWHLEGYNPGGEMIWLSSVLDSVDEAGYIVLHAHEYLKWVNVARLIPDLVHQYWASEIGTLSCVWDPRCIKEYVPNIGGPDLSIDVPDAERGILPIGRLMTTTYFGSLPTAWTHPGYEYGFREEDESWSYNPLGQGWTLTPYAYPNNTFLPWSIEKTCLKVPYTAHSERNNTVLIYGKWSSIIVQDSSIPPDFWDSETVHGLEYDFLSTAAENDLGREMPMPAGLKSIGLQTQSDYSALLGSVRAVVGMGRPRLSPTVFSALCQGTPVIIPIYNDNYEGDERDQWTDRHTQHPVVLALGEPYAWPYRKGDTKSMLAQIDSALKHNLERYIPPDMREPFCRETISAVLGTDFVARSEAVIAANGGKPPAMSNTVRELTRHEPYVIPPGIPTSWVDEDAIT